MSERCGISILADRCCAEVYITGGKRDGCLLGYAILFSGKWDAWVVQYPVSSIMRKVATGLETMEDAICKVNGFA